MHQAHHCGRVSTSHHRLLAGLVLVLWAMGAAVGCSSKPEVLPQDEFWMSMSALCGKAYPGRVVVDSTDSPTFSGKPLALHVAECDETRMRMPLLIDGKPWATLELTRVDGQLGLKHLHEQVQDAPPSGYGGVTRAGGTPISQDFYANEFTESLNEDAADTVWTLEIRPGAVLGYALRREGTDRRFRMVFDLSRGRPAPTVLPER